MGKWVEDQVPVKKESGEVRCRYRAEVVFVLRSVDVDTWKEYLDDLPESYNVVKPHKADNGTTTAVMTYVAASANSHDIMRRLRASSLHFVPGSTNRTKLCDCPSGTTKCLKRTTK